MKVRDVIRRLEDDGWVLDRTRGSHRQYAKEGVPSIVTVSGKPSDEVHIGTLRNIYRQAGWDWERQ